MFSLLLAIIYVAFISLGLPDSLLGSAWPAMRVQFGAPVSFAGVISMIIAGGTIVSSLMSDRMTRKLGAGLVTAVSVGMTAVALLGFSLSGSLWMLCLWAIPYGLGAGAVDAALNNYVALHYAARHMSWLHCFWGVGASISPYIMSACLSGGAGWQSGYRTVFYIQIVLTAALFLSLSLWKNRKSGEEQEEAAAIGLKGALGIPGVPYMLVAFLCYCAMEATTGLWASTYLVEARHVSAETAARFASLFYLGITFGRFVNGFVADRMGDKRLIRLGTVVILLGTVLIMLPVQTEKLALAGLMMIGLGCAPIYPSIIHATPNNFGKENSQAIVGIQMASAYTGSTFLPPLFGVLASQVSVGLYPFFLALFAALLLLMTEKLNRLNRAKEQRG
ncbi:MAG: MFS transporter [Eubacteriales bacterium]|nr:MFS transporter [Eubacteriales bacterium]